MSYPNYSVMHSHPDSTLSEDTSAATSGKEESQTAPKSIAVLRMSALGDVIMTVPLLRTLQQAYPNTPIYWIVSRPFHTMVEGISGIELIVINKPRGIRSYWQLFQQLKAYEIDWLLVPQASMSANLVTMAVKAKRKIGYDTLHARDFQKWFVKEYVPARPEHLIDSFLSFAHYIGVKESVLKWDLPLSKTETQWATEKLSNCSGIKLAVGLAASKAERNWPVERYRDCINRIAAHWDVTVVLIGGPGNIEKEKTEEFTSGLNANICNLVGQSSMRQLAAVLGQVDALLAPDTGPLHIAQAMGTPVVGLYAVAPAKKTGPYVEPQWTVDVFDEAVETILRRTPGLVSWRQRVHTNRSMLLIQVDDVVAKLEALFADRGFFKKT